MYECKICSYVHAELSINLIDCHRILLRENNSLSVINEVLYQIAQKGTGSIAQSTIAHADSIGLNTAPFKQKEGKLRFDLIPPEMDLAFAQVATFGIDKLKKCGVKNPDRNWEAGLKLISDHLAAMKRHVNKWERGIDNDEESDILHLKHALWHLAAMVTMIERGRKDLDDRVKS